MVLEPEKAGGTASVGTVVGIDGSKEEIGVTGGIGWTVSQMIRMSSLLSRSRLLRSSGVIFASTLGETNEEGTEVFQEALDF